MKLASLSRPEIYRFVAGRDGIYMSNALSDLWMGWSDKQRARWLRIEMVHAAGCVDKKCAIRHLWCEKDDQELSDCESDLLRSGLVSIPRSLRARWREHLK